MRFALIHNPLQPPENNIFLESFGRAFQLDLNRPPERLLTELVHRFSRLPYENLSKIVKEAQLGQASRARRMPEEVLADHLRLGTGGTCFSLTAALLRLVRSLGFEAQPLLADRRYGANTHCAIVVMIDSRPHLLDPGYLVLQPLALPTDSDLEVKTAFNSLVLRPQLGGQKVELYTRWRNQLTYRLTFRTQPADASEFLHAWDDSFDWDGMRYPVLTCVRDQKQHYLQGNRFQIRGQNEIERQEIAPDLLVQRIASEFGIAQKVVAQALRVLKERGE